MLSVSMRRIWYGSVVAGAADVLPDLLLARVIGRDRERHELLERHAVLGIDVEQLRRHRRQAQALLDDRRRRRRSAAAISSSLMPCRAASWKARN